MTLGTPREEDWERDDDTNRLMVESLSEREQDTIRCLARGNANKEIADELCISVHTVATHRRNISTKLDIHSPAGLVIFDILHHLVDIKDVALA